ncbi:MAG: polysaccharide biosynthesis protein [Lachnospiraceae bacterium]|nr:polysaccharide biosynthesis protein [Lachnospiraceae bacterium]
MKETKTKRKKKKPIEHWQFITLLMMLFGIVAIHAAYFLALWMRFDFTYSAIPAQYLLVFTQTITVYSIVCVVVFLIVRLYRSIWRFASYMELLMTMAASAFTSVVYGVVITSFFQKMPVSYHLLGAALQFIFLIGIRFSYRLYLLIRRTSRDKEGPVERVMLIGAGSAGQMILRDINHGGERRSRVVCLIDDNPNKWNRYIDGVPVVGGRDDILPNAEKYRINKIYFAIPSASSADRREILNICKETGCALKQLPRMYQDYEGQVSTLALRSVSMEDLLGREPIETNMNGVFKQIKGKTVLVTGGGGSIGSELCRQIADHRPGRLIIFDIYENNVYDIQQELKKKHPELDLRVLIGSVRDSRRVFDLFETYRPQIVYHAAAHKHVPLMEDSPCEAIKNNTLGTYKTAYAAMVHGCERFVLISTDKAVNPTNIMGASKRLCEMVIQSFSSMIKEGRAAEIPQLFTHEGNHRTVDPKRFDFSKVKTEFAAVRFGNVLGSNGSVVPLFRRQIENGGPVTVTHPDIIRYFMTISEAVSLVMLAGTYAKGGEIFVLDMGSPVSIDSLARNLIKLSGYRPDVDIKIVYTGLRPGEKLYEEKLMEEEGLQKTENDLIHIGAPIPFDKELFFRQMASLMQAAYNNKRNIEEMVAEMVPTYHLE